TVHWGDTTFPVNTSVTSKFDSDIVRVAYRYSFVNEPGGELAVLLGAHWTNLDTSISNPAGTLSKSISVAYPLPTLGMRGSARAGAPTWACLKSSRSCASRSIAWPAPAWARS